MVDETNVRCEVEIHGYAVREAILSGLDVDALIEIVERHPLGEDSLRRGKVYAIRNLLDLPEISHLANSGPLSVLAGSVLGDNAFPVRGILFDKIPEANWKVPWHQDVTIAVQEKKETEGFGLWSTKAGILHVQPPAAVLERMISIRLHLDACDESNGALHVIPGSHLSGRIAESELASVSAKSHAHVCAVGRGGVLVMRPLLLHASSPAQSPAHRRVIHIDYACDRLPSPLKWLSPQESST